MATQDASSETAGRLLESAITNIAVCETLLGATSGGMQADIAMLRASAVRILEQLQHARGSSRGPKTDVRRSTVSFADPMPGIRQSTSSYAAPPSELNQQVMNHAAGFPATNSVASRKKTVRTIDSLAADPVLMQRMEKIATKMRLYDRRIARRHLRDSAREARRATVVHRIWSDFARPRLEALFAAVDTRLPRFRPAGRLFRMWNLLIVLTLLYVWISQPLQAAFPGLVASSGSGSAFFFGALDVATDILFIADVGVRFRVTYIEEGLLVSQASLMAKNYMRSGFRLDLASSFPYPWFVGGLVLDGANDTRPHMARMIRSMRLMRVLLVLLGLRENSRFEKALGATSSHHRRISVLRVIQVIVVMLLLSHW